MASGRFHHRRWFSLLLACLCCTLAAFLWSGCSPQGRYQVLSFFFDGVPDPNAPAEAANGPHVAAGTAAASRPSVRIVSVHPPYAKGQCNECHRTTSGDVAGFSQAAGPACLKCHEKVRHEYPMMHGPVAVAACDRCHQPHESTEPALLRETAAKVCTQCHDEAMLGLKPAEHQDKALNCLQCHNGHGGVRPPYLRQRAAATMPTTQPATQPTTAPAPSPTSTPPVLRAGLPPATGRAL